MSWDLVFWKGSPIQEPPDVWAALAGEQIAQFLKPLNPGEMRRAFEEEYGEEIQVEHDDDARTTLMGRGWEGSLAEGELYFYVMCSWGLANDDDLLTKLVRAGLRAGCFVFDPQSSSWWEPPDTDWAPDAFNVRDSVRSRTT